MAEYTDNLNSSATPSEAVLCLGSNVEPRLGHISDAISLISDFASIISYSSTEDSPDFTGKGHDYLNIVLKCSTDLSLSDFAARLSGIEMIGGRCVERTEAGMVDIDIDLVLWNRKIVSPKDFERNYFKKLYGQISADSIISPLSCKR